MSNAKMRKLIFNSSDSGGDIFSIYYDAFRFTFGEFAKGYDSLKLCSSIGDKLEGISIESPLERDRFKRELKSGSHDLLFSQTEWEKLKAMVESEKVEWTANARHRVLKCIEHVRAAEEVTVKEEIVKGESK